MAGSPSSAKALFVLGRIAVRPTYGHDIMRTLAASRSDLWAELSEKHVYYILKKLECDGLVSVSSERDGGRPARHMYTITPAGIAEFERLIRSERLIDSTPYSDFDVVFGMLAYTDRLSPAEKDALLEARAQHLRSVVADAESAIAEISDSTGGERTHTLSSRVFSKVAMTANAELTWLGEVQADITRLGWPAAGPNAVRMAADHSTDPNPNDPNRSDS